MLVFPLFHMRRATMPSRFRRRAITARADITERFIQRLRCRTRRRLMASMPMTIYFSPHIFRASARNARLFRQKEEATRRFYSATATCFRREGDTRDAAMRMRAVTTATTDFWASF